MDVPNATVMMIEGANRFGLAQLHQFRGRVGRGEHPSYCLLIPDAEDEAEQRAAEGHGGNQRRLPPGRDAIWSSAGPGDFLGTRQSGFAELRMARLTDVRLIEKARREAQQLFEADPGLVGAPNTRSCAPAVGLASGQATKGEIS